MDKEEFNERIKGVGVDLLIAIESRAHYGHLIWERLFDKGLYVSLTYCIEVLYWDCTERYNDDTTGFVDEWLSIANVTEALAWAIDEKDNNMRVACTQWLSEASNAIILLMGRVSL